MRAKDLPGKLDLKIKEAKKNDNQDDIDALDVLLRRGILTQQEYDEKVKKLLQ